LTDGCVGAATRITNQSIGGAGFQWFVNGESASSQSMPQLMLPSGRVTVKLIAQAGQCVDSLSKQVVITAAPAPVSFSLDRASGCSPLPVTLRMNGTARNDVNYAWQFGDGDSSRIFQPMPHRYVNQTTKTQTFRVTVTARNACGTQTSGQDITVKPLAKADVGVDSTTARCTPAQIKFSNRSTGHDKANAIWVFGNGRTLQSGQDTVLQTYSTRDTAQTYRIQLIVSNECGRDTARTSVRVFPTIVKPLFTLDKPETCPNDTIRFTDATVPKPIRVVWKFGDGTMTTQPTAKHSYPRENTTYQVTMIAYTTCGYDSLSRPVKITTLPNGDFTVAAPFACQNQGIRLDNRSNPANGFAWNFGDGSPVDSVQFSPVHVYKTEGNKRITLTIYGATKTCKRTLSKEVVVRAKTTADFEIDGDSVVCSPGPIRLLNRSKNADRWRWTFSNGDTSTVENPVLAFRPGRYDVQLQATFAGACQDSVYKLSVFTIDSCGIEVPEAFSPNLDGIGDRYTIFGKGIRQINQLKIRNRWGEIVFEAENIPAGSQRDGESWDGTHGSVLAPPDMYTYEYSLEFKGGRVERKAGNFFLIR
jgi:gliding motility-associated-like protein